MIGVQSVAMAYPDHHLSMKANDAFIREMFDPPERVMRFIAEQGVEKRRVIQPYSWYTTSHSFAERNALAVNAATDLSVAAAKNAIHEAGVVPADVVAIVFVTSTVLSMPGIEAALVPMVGLSSTVLRVPVWGRGCAGGVAGLVTAVRLSEGFDGAPVLLMNAECCTANVQRDERTAVSMLISAMYADSAAAAIISAPTGQGLGANVLGMRSTLVESTTDICGWNLVDTGLSYHHLPVVTRVCDTAIPSAVASLLDELGIAKESLTRAALYPRNAEAIRKQCVALGINDTSRNLNLEGLRVRGNLSAPSVLAALADRLQLDPTGDPLLVLATGPGYCVEQIILQW
jgi:alkylresorcinol/alkylpyrone synthase